LVPGVVPLVLGRVHELAPPEQTRAAWSLATIAFAVGQAIGAYGLSWLFASTADYSLLFELGAAAILLALLIDLAFARR
jgi:predicted MFS family arabinose efflux permease